MSIEVKTHKFAEGGFGITAKVSEYFGNFTAHEISRLIAEKIAERYVAENYVEIAEKLSQKAVANLSVAAAGAKIREALEKEVDAPSRVVTETKREVYQRGLLGGLKRVL